MSACSVSDRCKPLAFTMQYNPRGNRRAELESRSEAAATPSMQFNDIPAGVGPTCSSLTAIQGKILPLPVHRLIIHYSSTSTTIPQVPIQPSYRIELMEPGEDPHYIGA